MGEFACAASNELKKECQLVMGIGESQHPSQPQP